MLKIALVLVKIVFFGLKKGISRLLHWVAQKYTAPNMQLFCPVECTGKRDNSLVHNFIKMQFQTVIVNDTF